MIKFFNYFFEGEEKKKMKLADNGCGMKRAGNRSAKLSTSTKVLLKY